LAAAQKQLEILQGPLVSESSFVPELALLDCHACHENPLHSQDWSRGLLTRLVPPGAVPFADGYLKMAWLITRRIDAGTADAMLSQIQTLQRASAQRREQVVAASAQLTRSIAHTIAAADTHPWSREDVAGMMLQIVEMGASGEYRDYISAEQAVMAIELLMIDLGTASQHRKTLDAMYGMLRNDDAYLPAQMRETMASLATTLRQQRPEN
jgi:hypothetical protein